MVAALGNSKDYSLKQYLLFANKLQTKAKVSECYCLLIVNYIFMCVFSLLGEKIWKYFLAVINDVYGVRALLDCNKLIDCDCSVLFNCKPIFDGIVESL